MADKDATRKAIFRRWGALDTDRSSWLGSWAELAHYLLPRSGRFDTSTSGRNRGDKKFAHIYDSSATGALNVLTAGLLSGASSPARPWFKLRTPDEDLNQQGAVKEWLWKVEQRMREIFNHSNTYRSFRQCYQELACFGTAANIVLPNYDKIVRNFPLTIGEYALDVDGDGDVDTLYRKYDMTVGQLVDRFGYKNCSRAVRNLYDRGQFTPSIPILHAIEPRRDRDPLKLDNRNMACASNYYEFGGDAETVLRESGYDEFPALTPRWETRGADVYGAGPGQLVLGDVKQLQHQQLRKSQAIDFQTLPPLAAPPSAMAGGLNLAPGSVNYVDPGTQGVRSLFEVQLDLGMLLSDIADVRGRIDRGFYVDLFLLMVGDQRAQPATAREISERHEEKLIMLGPVLESLHDEFLGPYIEKTFAFMMKAGIVPPPPEELSGAPLTIQFVSMLAQAQRLVGLSNVERLIGSVVNVSAARPETMDKLDFDKAVEVYGDLLGTDPTLIVPGDQVALVREQRAAAAQKQQQIAAAQQGAAVAKDLGAAGVDGRDAAVQAAQQLGVI